MIAAIFGKIDGYDGEQEEWPQYVKQLGHFFAAKVTVTGDRKCSIFHTVNGTSPSSMDSGGSKIVN